MKVKHPSPGLRGQLHSLTEKLRHRDEHAEAFAFLRTTHPHSIELIEDGGVGPHGFNCFMYAFGLRVLPPHLVAIARKVEIAHPSVAFATELLGGDVLTETSSEDAQNGDIVIYFNEGRPTHAGIIEGDLVVSKWGIGNVWRHPLLEVPSNYGDQVRYFRPPDPAAVLARFQAFVDRIAKS